MYASTIDGSSSARAGDLQARDDWQSPIFIAFGSNLGDRAANLRQACSALDTCAGIAIAQRSCLYSSLSMYDDTQPNFLNMVCECRTVLEPLCLLSTLKKIERDLGRPARAERYSARIIDLDLIYYADLLFSHQVLEIPHPRLAERPFVLNPLSEIAPCFHDPLRDCSVASLHSALQERKHEALRL